MKPVSVVTIEMYTHADSNRPSIIRYFEYTVIMDGEEVYRVKTQPRKWNASTDPVRIFEKWLLDDYPKNRSNISKNIQAPFGDIREACRKFLKLRLQLPNLKLQFLSLKFKKFFFRLKAPIFKKFNGCKCETQRDGTAAGVQVTDKSMSFKINKNWMQCFKINGKCFIQILQINLYKAFGMASFAKIRQDDAFKFRNTHNAYNL